MKPKAFFLDGLKCQCGHPTYLHITEVAPTGKAYFACQRYLYTRANDGCCGFIYQGEIFWEDVVPTNGKEEFYSNVSYMNRT